MITAAATLLLSLAQGTAPLLLERPSPVPPPIVLPPSPPPAPPPPVAVHARPRFNLASLVTREDYPVEARRAHIEGIAEFILGVGANGRVTDCTIVRTSGSAALDSATCRLMTSRARFIPASDPEGRPVPDSYRGSIVWRIGQDSPPPMIRTVPPPIVSTMPPPVIRMAPPAPPAPPPPPPFVNRARAKANLGSLISDGDYPALALRNREEGSVGFRLIVGPNGRVTDCSIVRSSQSVSLDGATCRLLTARARFEPARDSSGNTIADSVVGRIVWRIVNDFDRPWAPALFVEEMRSSAAGTVSCWQGWDRDALIAEACPPEEGVRLARRAQAARTALTRSIVTRLTPEGMAETADRPGRGEPFLAADMIFTIGADGTLLECRVQRNEYVGRRRPPGMPPDPCADWDVGTNRLYAPAAGGEARRTVRVEMRGYVGAPAPPAP